MAYPSSRDDGRFVIESSSDSSLSELSEQSASSSSSEGADEDVAPTRGRPSLPRKRVHFDDDPESEDDVLERNEGARSPKRRRTYQEDTDEDMAPTRVESSLPRDRRVTFDDGYYSEDDAPERNEGARSPETPRSKRPAAFDDDYYSEDDAPERNEGARSPKRRRASQEDTTEGAAPTRVESSLARKRPAAFDDDSGSEDDLSQIIYDAMADDHVDDVPERNIYDAMADDHVDDVPERNESFKRSLFKRRKNDNDGTGRQQHIGFANMGFTPFAGMGSTPYDYNANTGFTRIASIKRGGKARSASPLTGPSTTFTPPNTFTTTPSSFSFGGAGPQQQQSQSFGGGSNGFTFGQQQTGEANGQGSAPAPSNSFTFGQSQPQPSANGFGQGQQPSNPFGGFGQQDTQNNGAQATPSFGGFGQQSQNTNSSAGTAPSNPFSGFGQQTQNTTSTPATSFNFGAQSQAASPAPTNPFSGFNSQPQQNGTAPSTSFTFGAQPPATQSSMSGATTPSFGGFGASQPSQQPASQPTNNLFAPKPSTEQKSPSPFEGNNSLFSKPAEAPKSDGWASFKTASPAPANGSENSGASVLSGWQNQQTSKPSFVFSQSQAAKDDGDDDDAMASPEKAAPASSAFGGTSNLFATPKPAATAGNDLFSRISSKPAEPSADTSATPKAPALSSGNLFASATPAPKASNPFAGFSVAPPATAPAKNMFSGAGIGSAVPATPTPAAEKEPETPATVKPAQSTSFFGAGASSTPAASSLFAPKPVTENAPEPSATPKPAPAFTNSLFAPKPASETAPEPASTFKPAPTSTSSLFAPKPAPETAPEPASTFKPAPTGTSSLISSSVSKHPAASLFTPAVPQDAPTSSTSQSTQPTTQTDSAKHITTLRELNQGIIMRLNKADLDADFTQIFKFYIKKAEVINKATGGHGRKASSSNSVAKQVPQSTAQQTPITAPPKNLFESTANKRKPSGDANAVDLTKSLFAPRAEEAQTPKPAFTNGLFGQVPSTEPSKKRSIESEGNNVPHTEKRRKPSDQVEYSKLPAGASDTAKLFEAALDKPASAGTAAASLFAPKPAEQKTGEETSTSTFGGFKPNTSSLFAPKPTTEAPKSNGVSSSTSLFAPKAAAPASASMPKPAAGGFMPTFAAPPAGGSSFLSSFGESATKEQDAARKKAMAEDFDSEDDDEEEWKKEYEEKQAAKRKAIEDAAKSGGGFSMKAPTPKPAVIEEEDEETKEASGDNTWKQGTPIKFGAEAATPVAPFTAPPKGTSMFGNTAGSSLFANAGSKTPQPSSGSSLFSQAKPTQTNGSSSLFSFSKPADTTAAAASKPDDAAQSNTESAKNGDAAEGDEEAANDPQVEDMTALQPSEQAECDVLYYVEKAKSYKFETKLNADKPEWNYKALGPVWLLRNKSTGKTRMLQKVAPLGKAGMNFNVLKVASMYNQQNKKLMASFVDHINEKEPSKPSQWFVQFGKEEDAKELARLVKEEAEKQ